MQGSHGVTWAVLNSGSPAVGTWLFSCVEQMGWIPRSRPHPDGL